MYTTVRLPRPFAHGPVTLDALDYCLGRQTDATSVLHVRGRCDGDIAFAGGFTLAEGRDVPDYDLATYGEPRDAASLGPAIEACLAERTTVLFDEIVRFCGPGGRHDERDDDH